MSPDLQAELIQRYPKFFRSPGLQLSEVDSEDTPEDRLESNEGPFDHYGIECGDGWYAAVDRLCQACEFEIEALIGKGVAQESWPRVVQIKEKAGTLRFYLAGQATEALRSQIQLAETESRSTCEQCGKPGLLRDGRWRKTQCDACYAQVLTKRS